MLIVNYTFYNPIVYEGKSSCCHDQSVEYSILQDQQDEEEEEARLLEEKEPESEKEN